MQQKLITRLHEVYPELSIHSVASVSGQNHHVLVVNSNLIFRFPRYAEGRVKLPGEAAVLRAIKPFVSLPTPDPVYSSFEPEAESSFIGYPMIPGEPLSQETLASISDTEALWKLGGQAASFLHALHQMPIAKLQGNSDAFDRLAEWQDLYARIRLALFPQMRADARAEVADRFESFLVVERTDQPIEPVLVHGDFGADNMIYDPRTQTLAGIIDFEESSLGDPAVDFAALPCSPRAFLEGVLSVYPDDLAPAGARAEFYRSTFALQEALFGLEHGDHAAYDRGIEAFR